MKASLRIQNGTEIHKNRHCVSMYLFVGLQDQLMPHVDRIVSLQTIIINFWYFQKNNSILAKIFRIHPKPDLNSQKLTLCQYVPFCRPEGPIDATCRPHCLVANNNPECSLEPDYRNVPRSNRCHTQCSIVAQLEFKKKLQFIKVIP